MDLLILGGTRFVGRAIVEEALAKGHTVTLVHRGQTGDDLFAGKVEIIHADRLVSLDALKDRSWDACIDTCAYVPRAIRIAGEALKGRVRRYTFISTISVYKDPAPGAGEDAPLIEDGDPDNEAITGDTYGYLKVLCEREVVNQFGSHSFLPRPGVVFGPNDHTDRFNYWVHRIATEPRVLVPADKTLPLQWIDARDLASFVVSGTEQGLDGAYNAIGPSTLLSEALETVRNVVNPSCVFVEADLAATEIQPWTDLPLVGPSENGIFRLSPQKAADAGMTPRPLADTARDVHRWFETQGREPVAGMAADRHRNVLEGLDGPSPWS